MPMNEPNFTDVAVLEDNESKLEELFNSPYTFGNYVAEIWKKRTAYLDSSFLNF